MNLRMRVCLAGQFVCNGCDIVHTGDRSSAAIRAVRPAGFKVVMAGKLCAQLMIIRCVCGVGGVPRVFTTREDGAKMVNHSKIRP